MVIDGYREQLEQVLRRVGLESVDRLMAPERLSGGQQRRLSLAVQLPRELRCYRWMSQLQGWIGQCVMRCWGSWRISLKTGC